MTWRPTAAAGVRLEYRIPARGLIGFQGEFLNLTRGTGLMSHIFDGYDAVKGEIAERQQRRADQQRSRATAVAYALCNLQERGRMFVEPGDQGLRRHDHRHPQPRQRSGRSTRSRARSSPTCALRARTRRRC
jgi:predicted membrane GTPase involved in stress response